MTPQQLIDLVAQIRTATNSGINAWGQMDRLLRRVEARIDQNEPLNVPLTQDQVNGIITTYAPIYTAILPLIEAAGDALGTDNF